MTSLRRRLGKLEAQLIDSSGLVPHTSKWLEYWQRWFDNLRLEPCVRPKELIPIDAARAVMAHAPDDEYLLYKAKYARSAGSAQ